MDRHLLIAEIRKRPELWDFDYGKNKSRVCLPDLWNEVGRIVGADVVDCKKKWKNLRDAYRSELKRIETRIESDILKGLYNSKTDYNSKWTFFAPMTFMNKLTRARTNAAKKSRLSIDYDNNSLYDNKHPEFSNDNDLYNNDDEVYNDGEIMYNDDTHFNNMYEIKMEPQQSMEDEDVNLMVDEEEESRDRGQVDMTDNSLFNDSNYLDTSSSAANNRQMQTDSKYLPSSRPPPMKRRTPVVSMPAKHFSDYQQQHDHRNSNSYNAAYNESRYSDTPPPQQQKEIEEQGQVDMTDNSLCNDSNYLDIPSSAANNRQMPTTSKYLPSSRPPPMKRRTPVVSDYQQQHDHRNNSSYNAVYNESRYSDTPPPHHPVKISIKNFSGYNRSECDHNQPSNSASKSSSNCEKCSERDEDQVNFLENLVKEEQNLITNTRRDITQANRLDHIGDPDYNFLISFLPQLKKMSELQNLQFRAKMSEIILNVLTPSMTASSNTSPNPPTSNQNR